MTEEAKRLRDAIKLILSAVDNARLVPKPGCGTGGQTTESNLRGSVYNGVDAWPVEEARAVLECHVSAVKLDRTYEWSNAESYRAGRIAQAEEDERIASSLLAVQPKNIAAAIRANIAKLKDEALASPRPPFATQEQEDK